MHAFWASSPHPPRLLQETPRKNNAQKARTHAASPLPERRSDHATSMPRQLAGWGVRLGASHPTRGCVCASAPFALDVAVCDVDRNDPVPNRTCAQHRGARSGVKQRTRRKKARACAPTDRCRSLRGVATTKGRGSLVIGWPRPGHASPSIGTISIEAAPIIARAGTRAGGRPLNHRH